jgi:hypothetical protein
MSAGLFSPPALPRKAREGVAIFVFKALIQHSNTSFKHGIERFLSKAYLILYPLQTVFDYSKNE